MAYSSTTNEWATGLLPHVTIRQERLRRRPIIRSLASFHGCSQPGKVTKTVNSCVASFRMRRTCW
jgi:hypothetical protein